LAESLLLIFARLVHAHGVSIVDFLQNIGEVDVHVKTKVETPPAPGEVFPKVLTELHYTPCPILLSSSPCSLSLNSVLT
jgi:hypothetical protein